MNLSQEIAFELAREYKLKLTHESFTDEEWMETNGIWVVLEDGVKCTLVDFMSTRQTEAWQDGWSVWGISDEEKEALQILVDDKRIDAGKRKAELALEDVQASAYEFMKSEIIKIAEKYNLKGISSCNSTEYIDADGKRVRNSDSITKEINDLVFWFDETFPRLGNFCYEDGQWHGEY